MPSRKSYSAADHLINARLIGLPKTLCLSGWSKFLISGGSRLAVCIAHKQMFLGEHSSEKHRGSIPSAHLHKDSRVSNANHDFPTVSRFKPQGSNLEMRCVEGRPQCGQWSRWRHDSCNPVKSATWLEQSKASRVAGLREILIIVLFDECIRTSEKA